MYPLIKEKNIFKQKIKNILGDKLFEQFITHHDPSISTLNLGDYIISDSVNEILENIFPERYIYRVSTQDHIGRLTQICSKDSLYHFVGGSNLLCSNIFNNNQWFTFV